MPGQMGVGREFRGMVAFLLFAHSGVCGRRSGESRQGDETPNARLAAETPGVRLIRGNPMIIQPFPEC
ncbi:hypothetical protein D3C72_2366250 [compost metagenome]